MAEEIEIRTLPCAILTPRREVFAGEILHLECDTLVGEIEIMPRHEPLLATLGIGLVHLKQDSGKKTFVIHGGFLEMTGDKVVILADEAENTSEIDLDRARQARDRAKERLAKVTTAGSLPLDISRAKLALLRSLRRISAMEANLGAEKP